MRVRLFLARVAESGRRLASQSLPKGSDEALRTTPWMACGPKCVVGRPTEHQGNVRVRDVGPSGNADLQCRRRRIRLKGGGASIAGYQADRTAELKAHCCRRAECGTAVHVPDDSCVRQLDVVRVSALTALRRIEYTRCGPVIGHRHIGGKIGDAPPPLKVQ